MPAERIQFGIKHLMIAMTVVASVATAILALNGYYEIYGGVGSVAAALFLFIFLLLSGLSLIASKRFRGLIVAAVISVCVIFSFQETHMRGELRALRVEIARMIEYSDKYHLEHGHYPVKLENYEYKRHDLRDKIEYEWHGGAYYIWFNPTGDRGYGHYYTPEHGFFFEDD